MKYTRLHTNLCKKLLLLSSITVVACSSAPKVDTDAVDSSQQLANAELKKQVEQQKAEWDAIKPEIERLLALEEDFKLLIQSLNTSQLSNSPQSLGGEVPAVSLAPAALPPSTPSPVEEILSSEGTDVQEEPVYMKAQFLGSSTSTKKMKDASSNKRILNSNQFAVQVAAYDNEILLAKGWLRLQGNFPELMSSVNPMKESITVKNKNLWALKVGPFASRSLAGNYCSQLKARKQDCFISMYKGEEL